MNTGLSLVIFKGHYKKYSGVCRHCEHKFRENQKILSKHYRTSKYYCLPCARRLNIILEDDEITLRQKLKQTLRNRKAVHSSFKGNHFHKGERWN